MKNMFWVVVIILIGVLVILNSVFGIKVLFGGFSSSFDFQTEKRSTDREAVFANSTFKYPHGPADGDQEYVTVFGSSQLPEKNKSAFGEFTYRSPSVKEGVPSLVIRTQVVFGNFEIVEKD